jgi:phospholipid-binding lipoprotein MlaA
MSFRVTAQARRAAGAIALALLLGAGGTAASAGDAAPADQARNESIAQAQPPAADANDPLEPVNRAIFAFNDFIYALIIRPIAEAYVLVIPQEARDGVRNVLANAKSPVVLANDLLQGEFTRAWQTTERMFINTTVGVGGVVDVAKMWGINGHTEDLGQTLAVWGVPDPFFLVLPILGPSSPRDAVGQFADGYLDPISYWMSNTDREAINYGRDAMSGVDSYSRVMDDLQKLKETSIDYYAAVRGIYRQKRETEIRNGAPQVTPLPEIRYDLNAGLSNSSH